MVAVCACSHGVLLAAESLELVVKMVAPAVPVAGPPLGLSIVEAGEFSALGDGVLDGDGARFLACSND